MAKATWVNVSGTWKKVKNVWTNVNGTWKQKVLPKGAVDGSWKEFMQYMYDYIFYAYGSRIIKLKHNNLSIQYDKTFKGFEGRMNVDILSQTLDKDENVYISTREQRKENVSKFITIAKFLNDGTQVFYKDIGLGSVDGLPYTKIYTKKDKLFHFIGDWRNSSAIYCECYQKDGALIYRSAISSDGGNRSGGTSIVSLGNGEFLGFPLLKEWSSTSETVSVHKITNKETTKIHSNNGIIGPVYHPLIKKINYFIPLTYNKFYICNSANSNQVLITIYDIPNNKIRYNYMTLIKQGENWNFEKNDASYIWVEQIEFIDNFIYMFVNDSINGTTSRDHYLVKVSLQGEIIKTQKSSRYYSVFKSQGEYIYGLQTPSSTGNAILDQYDKDLNLITTRYVSTSIYGNHDILTTDNFEMEDLNI